MVDSQLRSRGITDASVLRAMGTVPRERFVPEGHRAEAYTDMPLPVGHGQTISQPYMVALMAELLDVAGKESVLDVGTGSGYAAAVLAELVDDVVTVELVPELAEGARSALDAAGYGRVECRVGDGSLGAADRAPFDGINVAAAGAHVPAALVEQLADGGRLVMPVGRHDHQRLLVIERRGETLVEHPSIDCRFVPLIVGARDPGP